MSYTDGTTVYHYLERQCETAAAVEKLIDRQGEPATAAAQQVFLPNGGTILAWGLNITEAITNANATKWVAKLQTKTKSGATAVASSTMTMPKDTTDVTPSTQTNPSDRTATQAVAVGARLLCTNNMPVQIGPGGYFYVETTTAAGAAGGAGEFFVLVREEGGLGATTTSPVTKISA